MKTLNKKLSNSYTVFLLVVATHFVSLLGSAMTRFALGVWAYQTTGQVMDFAGVLVAGFLPGILLSPVVGVWIDRKGPPKLILWGDIIGAGAIVIVSMFFLGGNLSIGHVLFASAALSVVSTMQAPALTSIVPQLVSEEKLSRANGFLSTATSVSDVLGPVLASVLMGLGNLSYILTTDLLSYAVSISFLCMLWSKLNVGTERKEANEPSEKESIFKDMKEGLTILYEKKSLLTLVLLFTVLNFALGLNQVLGQPYILSMGTAKQYGLLSSIFGIGMVLGGLIMSFKEVRNHLVQIVLLANLFIGVFIALTGLVNQLLFIGLLWIGIGILLPIVNTTTLTLIQTNTEPCFLGRVFSIARMFAWISLPAAYILGGFTADHLIKSSFAVSSFFGQGKSGTYGMLLAVTGSIIIITIIIFSQIKSLYKLGRKDKDAA